MQVGNKPGLELSRDEIGDLVAVVPAPCLEQQSFQRTVLVGVLPAIVPKHPATVEFHLSARSPVSNSTAHAPIAKFRMLRLKSRQPGHFPQSAQHSLRLGLR